MSEVQHFEVVSEDIENPYTMVKIRHVSNGATYEARGWALWDGQGEYREWEGVGFALKRARRKIAARLAWEAGLGADTHATFQRICAATIEHDRVAKNLALVVELHRDGGTVQL